MRFLQLLVCLHLLRSELRLAQTAKSLGEFEMCFGQRDLQLDGSLKILHRFFPLVKLNLDDTEVVMSVVVLRVELRGFLQMGSRRLRVSVLRLDDAAEIQNFGVVRTRSQKFGSHGTRLLILVQKYEDAKEFDLLVNVVWVGVGGFCHELDGVGVAVHSDEYDSHRFCKVDGVGMELKTFFEDAFGIIEISELAKGAGEID